MLKLQYLIQFKRFAKIYLIGYRKLLRIVILPLILGLILSFVFQKDYNNTTIDFMQNSQYAQLLFMCIITSIFLGLLTSISEILNDMEIIEKESLFGASILAHVCAKFSILTILVTTEVFLLYNVVHKLIKIPDVFFWSNFQIISLTAITSVAIGLFFSALSKTNIIAYNMISILIIPQIILGGGLLTYDSLSSSAYMFNERKNGHAPIISIPWPSRWAFEKIVIANLESDDPLEFNDSIKSVYQNNSSLHYMNYESQTTYLKISLVYILIFIFLTVLCINTRLARISIWQS